MRRVLVALGWFVVAWLAISFSVSAVLTSTAAGLTPDWRVSATGR